MNIEAENEWVERLADADRAKDEARRKGVKDREIADRLRRIETRLVKFFEHYGFDTQREKPAFKEDGIHIVSMETSIADILAAIPDGTERHQYIAVIHKGEVVITIYYT